MTDFSSLYRKYASDVYRFALYLSNERGEAEDITSETFVRAWTSPERHVPLGDDLRDRQASPYARAEQNEKLNSVLAEPPKTTGSKPGCAANARGGRNAV